MRTNTSTRTEDGNAAQGHLTIIFPMKSAADCAAVRNEIPALVPDLYRAADTMGTLHYCRFIVLNEDTVCLLAHFDGELEEVLEDLPRHFGPVLDTVLAHVSDPPPTPVVNNPKAFGAWVTDQCIKPFADYKSSPGATAQHIRSLASTAGIELDAAGAQQLPLLVIMCGLRGSKAQVVWNE